jgi:hypothetical protein
MKPSYAAAFALAVCLGACTTKSAMNSWIGRPESQLLASWGAPDKTASFPDGGKVDTWVTTWSDDFGMHTCRKNFTVSGGGTVVKSEYSDCQFFF